MYARDLRYESRLALTGRWGIAIVAALLAGLLGGAMGFNSGSLNIELDQETLRRIPDSLKPLLLGYLGFAGFYGTVLFIIGGVIRLGYCRFLLNMQDSRNPDLKDIFSRFDRFGDGFLLSLFTGLFTALWMLLFIIPGIVAAYSYAMAPFIMEENPEMKAMDAIRASKAMMYGHKAELFVLDLSFLGWTILCILSLGIGFFWLNPYRASAYAAFYRRLNPAGFATPAIPEQNPGWHEDQVN